MIQVSKKSCYFFGIKEQNDKVGCVALRFLGLSNAVGENTGGHTAQQDSGATPAG